MKADKRMAHSNGSFDVAQQPRLPVTSLFGAKHLEMNTSNTQRGDCSLTLTGRWADSFQEAAKWVFSYCYESECCAASPPASRAAPLQDKENTNTQSLIQHFYHYLRVNL